MGTKTKSKKKDDKTKKIPVPIDSFQIEINKHNQKKGD